LARRNFKLYLRCFCRAICSIILTNEWKFDYIKKKKGKKEKKKKVIYCILALICIFRKEKRKTMLTELAIWPYGEYRGWHQQWYENHFWGWYVIWIENRLGPRLIIKVHLFKSPKWIKEPKIKDHIFFQIRVFWSYLHIPYLFCWQNTNLIVGGPLIGHKSALFRSFSYCFIGDLEPHPYVPNLTLSIWLRPNANNDNQPSF
jgi:hypothetical protein